MKKKYLNKKLSLKKMVIAELTIKKQADLKGGVFTMLITTPRTKDWSCRDTVCCC